MNLRNPTLPKNSERIISPLSSYFIVTFTIRSNTFKGASLKIAIAGAFGFIGKNLIEHLLEHTNHEVVAFSRSERESEHQRIHCVQVDLYSLKDTLAGFEGCDAAIYLVHSMAPGSRLSQGHFRDYDFILADNFARAAKENGLKHIIYVGGIIPEQEKLSVHLESRLEVEQVLRSTGIPVTTFRCGLVIGPTGSSFQIVVKLVQRLPVMILPSWMRTKSSPIYIKDLARLLQKSLENPPSSHQVIDAGMDEPASYKDILIASAKAMKKSPVLVDFPYVSPHLSKLWVTVVSGSPKELVYPLIDSVSHEMVSDKKRGISSDWKVDMKNLDEAVNKSIEHSPTPSHSKRKAQVKKDSFVRSVQRMPLPRTMTARDVAKAYSQWIPQFLRPILRIETTDKGCTYYFRGLPIPLLILNKIEATSSDSRYIFRVVRGLLVKLNNTGRFEFRESPSRRYLIVALHDFRPALPWFIYRLTQAQIHKVVMNRFSKRLAKLDPGAELEMALEGEI